MVEASFGGSRRSLLARRRAPGVSSTRNRARHSRPSRDLGQTCFRCSKTPPVEVREVLDRRIAVEARHPFVAAPLKLPRERGLADPEEAVDQVSRGHRGKRPFSSEGVIGGTAILVVTAPAAPSRPAAALPPPDPHRWLGMQPPPAGGAARGRMPQAGGDSRRADRLGCFLLMMSEVRGGSNFPEK